MLINSDILGRINLPNFVSQDLRRWRDHFPPIIIETCLGGAEEAIVRYIEAAYGGGLPIPSEVLTMPRGGFGPRPISITDISSRLLYGALVSGFEDSLPESSRGPGKWDSYNRFGLGGSSDYVVSMDIASCYEYIDHSILRQELTLRSLDLGLSSVTHEYLDELLGQTKGLPQMLQASDRLADVYLDILERKLARDGYETARYVDDIRLIADNWEHANAAIERASEYAREIGLILSSEKTRIYKTNTLIDQNAEEAVFFDTQYQQAREALTEFWTVADYDDETVRVELAPEPQETALATVRRIVLTWWDEYKRKGPESSVTGMEQRFLNGALYILRDDDTDLPGKLLSDIVFEYPRKIEQVVSYLVARGQAAGNNERNLAKVAVLARMGRQSPWAKLWIMHAIEQLGTGVTGVNDVKITDWVKRQLSDRHEAVRAQAAWLCSTVGTLTSDELSGLYRRASTISQPALAAAAVRQGNIPSQVVNGIRGDSPLNQEACKWVESATS